MMPIRPTASGCKPLKNDGQRAALPIEPAPTIRVDHWCRGRSVFVNRRVFQSHAIFRIVPVCLAVLVWPLSWRPRYCDDAISDRRPVGPGDTPLVRSGFHGSTASRPALFTGALRDTRFVSVVTNRRDSNARLGAQARLSQPPIFRGANHLLLCGS